MPTLRQINRRIRSVQSTAKTTRAMSLVAGSKMRRAQQMALSHRPYADQLRWLLADVVESLESRRLPRAARCTRCWQRREVKTPGAGADHAGPRPLRRPQHQPDPRWPAATSPATRARRWSASAARATTSSGAPHAEIIGSFTTPGRLPVLRRRAADLAPGDRTPTSRARSTASRSSTRASSTRSSSGRRSRSCCRRRRRKTPRSRR